MRIHRVIGATVAQGLVLVSLSNGAFAQSSMPKKPNLGGKPLVQIKPTAPMGCKLVGKVKGTKLWAGECMAPPELEQPLRRKIRHPRRRPRHRLFRRGRNRSTRKHQCTVPKCRDRYQSGRR